MKRCETYTSNLGDDSDDNASVHVAKLENKQDIQQDVANRPHQALESPVLYHLLQGWFKWATCLFDAFYAARWFLSTPLERRLPFSRTLRKIKVIFTWSELLLILPFFGSVVSAGLHSFVFPSPSLSGHAARTPLIFAFATASHNSFLTFLLGLPFERAIRYHKLAARVAYINGLLHTYVSFVKRSEGHAHDTNFFEFLVADRMHTAGTFLIFYMTLMIFTAIPMFRRALFEFFYLCHIVFAASMVFCALFHTGYLVPLLAGIVWGGDLLVRRVFMARHRYHSTIASLRPISESVVEVSFPKTEKFSFNPGQYVFVSIPEVRWFEWHPFSLSSSPEQPVVTLHIRKAGDWTGTLHNLAAVKDEVDMYIEGPYGSVGVDILNKDKYKMIMLVSGGIGVTPMQSLCNQLMYEYSHGERDLKQLSFIWTERDPTMMREVDVVRRSSVFHTSTAPTRTLYGSLGSIPEFPAFDPKSPQTIGPLITSTLLSLVPASHVTDRELEVEYPAEEFADLDELGASIHHPDDTHRTLESDIDEEDDNEYNDEDVEAGLGQRVSSAPKERFLDKAYSFVGIESNRNTGPLDLQVYLTSKNIKDDTMEGLLPFVHLGRPDVKAIFAKMRKQAIAKGERRVAVCVCAPMRLVDICRRASVKYSDRKVAFDFHSEVFE